MPRRLSVTACVMVLLFLLCSGPTAAWERFDEGCSDCHNFFSGSPPLHDSHTGLLEISPGEAECQLCHRPAPDFESILTYRSGGGLTGPERSDQGCMGCHGRSYGETHPGDALPWSRGHGLRLHHMSAGPPICGMGGCHPSDPLPFGEHVLPRYYTRPELAVVLDPCDGSEDQIAVSHTVSLDNDGDTLYDANDPDCSAVPCDPLPGVVTDLLAIKPPGTDDVRLSWAWASDCGLYRVYSVSSKAAMRDSGPPRGDNADPSNQLRCETPDGATLTCDHTAGILASDPLLFYQVLGVCTEDHSVEGPN